MDVQFPGSTGFVVKLDAAGNVTVAARGVGVGFAAYDRDDNIYVAGVSAGLPTSTGAFQMEHMLRACAGTGLFAFICSYQHVAKLSPDGVRVFYSTFVTGSFGAVPAALAVNDAGEATVSGTTNSPDYPTTADSLLPVYRASGVRTQGLPSPHPSIIPTASSGYVTRLKADGSGLVCSTYFSGTGAESIGDMKILSGGRIAIAGRTASKDLPGLSNAPRGCAPLVGRELPYISILASDVTGVLSTFVPWEAVEQGDLGLTEGPDGSLGVTSARQYVQYDSGAQPRAACLADPADWTLLGQVAPGQLVTIFGDGLDSAAVDFNGSAARILSSSPEQINLQVPLDVLPDNDVTMRIASADRTMERHLRAVQSAPSVFLVQTPFGVATPGVLCDGRGIAPAYQPLALNEDGSANACARGAPLGSTVVLLLNGLGAQSPDVQLGNTADRIEPSSSIQVPCYGGCESGLRLAHRLLLSRQLLTGPSYDLPRVGWRSK